MLYSDCTNMDIMMGSDILNTNCGIGITAILFSFFICKILSFFYWQKKKRETMRDGNPSDFTLIAGQI
jgi:hypothetical protein